MVPNFTSTLSIYRIPGAALRALAGELTSPVPERLRLITVYRRSGDVPSGFQQLKALVFKRFANPTHRNDTQFGFFENFGEKKLHPLLASSHPPECYATFSPNGKWLAYVSNEPQVYVVPFPTVNAKIQVSKDFSYRPKWSRDGRELFYLTDDNMLTYRR